MHNRKLFEQNTQVVREVVELFQSYRLKYTSKQAFLGNLFELLLNSGFKQSEGQFFTPIPIARFIVRCLPLRERMAAAHAAGDARVIPKVMDYACGSAHFLTEVIEELQEDLAALDLSQQVSTTWARDCVWGIEKDYRLARTAKIALFLHGAGDANILHADGLEHDDALPKPGTLDVLIANPPYSVKDFKQHLNLRHNRFTLLPHLTSNSGEIETLFVERAAQLNKLRIAPTPAFLDFSRTGCDLAFNLSPQQAMKSVQFETRFDRVPFDQVATLEYGKPLPERSRIPGEFPVMGSNGIVGYHNEYLVEGPAIVVGRKGSAGKITYIEQNCFPIDTTFYVSCDKNKVALRYLQAILQELKLEEQAKAQGVPGLNRNDVYKFSIPLPPQSVQEKIVKAIAALEKKAQTYVIKDLVDQKRQILLDGIK
ncbi:MAG: N-6 DNA methylase [Candidatus Competibacteraceae bacterium]|nr:N-6 DNA methylase [Candidatus Competibacteraceae bacterium]MCP5126519.1 N-6 DNA methylase [Gammaproteobacteria bacterium]